MSVSIFSSPACIFVIHRDIVWYVVHICCLAGIICRLLFPIFFTECSLSRMRACILKFSERKIAELFWICAEPKFTTHRAKLPRFLWRCAQDFFEDSLNFPLEILSRSRGVFPDSSRDSSQIPLEILSRFLWTFSPDSSGDSLQISEKMRSTFLWRFFEASSEGSPQLRRYLLCVAALYSGVAAMFVS